MKRKGIIALALSALIVLTFGYGDLQAGGDEGFIYGKISAKNGKIYSGQIRWGKEEAFWTDMFNSTKKSNPYLKYLSRDEVKYMKDNGNDSWQGNFIIKRIDDFSSSGSHVHTFVCRFGDISSLTFTGSSSVDLKLRNGKVLKLGGGSNDLGATIRVYDEKEGLRKLSWSDIDKVEFMDTPAKLSRRMGSALYGTVETLQGSFTGYVQWDHDERLGTDKLDGEENNKDYSFEFSSIKSISKNESRSTVVLHDGSEYTLSGSNDVNKENRGIIVTVDGMGRVDIPWKAFRKVSFERNAPGSGIAYKEFAKISLLRGKVITVDDKILGGQIVYDLDESMDIELLHGKDEGLEYQIPFRYVKSIQPKNYKYSNVILKNGKKLLIGNMQDVSEKNDGLLVFSGDDDPIYIPWDKIQIIEFK